MPERRYSSQWARSWNNDSLCAKVRCTSSSLNVRSKSVNESPLRLSVRSCLSAWNFARSAALRWSSAIAAVRHQTAIALGGPLRVLACRPSREQRRESENDHDNCRGPHSVESTSHPSNPALGRSRPPPLAHLYKVGRKRGDGRHSE